MVAAVLYDPLRDELFTAEKGKGAYLNGRAHSCLAHAGAGRGAGGDGISQPQAA